MGISKDIRDKLDFINAVYQQGLQALKPAKPVVVAMVLHDPVTDTYSVNGKLYTAAEWIEFNDMYDHVGMVVTGPDAEEVSQPVRIEQPAEPLKQPVDFLNRRHKKVRKKKEVKQPEPVVMTDIVARGKLSDYGETWGLTADREWKKNKVLSANSLYN